jgi:transglutaminase-like putative cysteine protease
VKKRLTFFALSCTVLTAVFAGDGDYAVSKIPSALLSNANAVKRMEEIRFDLTNLAKPRLYKKYAITILNENGDQFAPFEDSYNKFVELSSIEGYLFDEKGKKIKSLKKDEIKDMSGTSESNLIDDTRIKFHNFFYKIYPYTVEYEYEIKYNTSAYFPEWEPQEGYNFAVQQSLISVIYPLTYTVRYKAFNYPGQPEKKGDKDNNVLTWQALNLPAIEREPLSPSRSKTSMSVVFGPSQFHMESYDGDMSSWASWGKFIYVLKQNRDELPEDVKKQVHQLTDGINDNRQKIKILYEYLQKNTRYISIQIGIGGWQPFDAKYVAAKKYGDCKALSNYMYALLKEAGIPSYYALIEAGENADDIITDFPLPQFNHATLCVPLGHDSIWLECTSQTEAAGYIGGFTGNRHALLITENGGKLVTTTKYGLQENLQLRKINGTVDAEGKLDFVSKTQMKGMERDDLHERINDLSKDKMMEFLKTAIDLPTYDVVKFEYTEDKERISSLYETIDITASNYAQVSGKRLFINPNIVNRSGRKLKTTEERKSDIELTDEDREIDSVEIKIPPGYLPESMPQDIKIENKFGKYVATVTVQTDRILYCRLEERYSGNFPASEYSSLVKYYEQLYKADRRNVVFVKKE